MLVDEESDPPPVRVVVEVSDPPPVSVAVEVRDPPPLHEDVVVQLVPKGQVVEAVVWHGTGAHPVAEDDVIVLEVEAQFPTAGVQVVAVVTLVVETVDELIVEVEFPHC